VERGKGRLGGEDGEGKMGGGWRIGMEIGMATRYSIKQFFHPLLPMYLPNLTRTYPVSTTATYMSLNSSPKSLNSQRLQLAPKL
jgi:hypothetical protein